MEYKSDEDGWAEAFSLCRERGCPMIVIVDGERWKIFPSGAVIQRSRRGGRMEGVKYENTN